MSESMTQTRCRRLFDALADRQGTASSAAEALGITPSRFWRYQHGAAAPDLAVLDKLYCLLGGNGSIIPDPPAAPEGSGISPSAVRVKPYGGMTDQHPQSVSMPAALLEYVTPDIDAIRVIDTETIGSLLPAPILKGDLLFIDTACGVQDGDIAALHVNGTVIIRRLSVAPNGWLASVADGTPDFFISLEDMEHALGGRVVLAIHKFGPSVESRPFRV